MNFDKIIATKPNLKPLIDELKQIKYMRANMESYHKLAKILYSIEPYATLVGITENSVGIIDIEQTLKNHKNTIERIKRRR